MSEELLLRSFLTTTRTLAQVLQDEGYGRIIAQMNEVLWSLGEKSCVDFAAEDLRKLLETVTIGRDSSQLDTLIYYFAQSFLIIVRTRLNAPKEIQVTPAAPITMRKSTTEMVRNLLESRREASRPTPPAPSLLKRRAVPEFKHDVEEVDIKCGTEIVFTHGPPAVDPSPSSFVAVKEEEEDSFDEDDSLDHAEESSIGVYPSDPKKFRYESILGGPACPLCPASLTPGITNSGIFKHLRKYHSDAPGTFFFCLKCNVRSRTPKHEKKCEGRVIFDYDPDANAESSNVIKTNVQRRIMLPGDECPFCSEQLGTGNGVSLSKLCIHLQKFHKGVSGTFFRCSVCQHVRYRDRDPISKHLGSSSCGGEAEFYHEDPRERENREKACGFGYS